MGRGLRAYLGDVIWVGRIALGVILILAGRAWSPFWHHILAVLVLATLAYPVRSVRWGTLYNLLLLGFLFSFVSIGAQYVIEQILLGGEHDLLGSVLVAPVTEEPLKILPLAVLLLWPRSGFRSYGATDMMLCAMALGTGFGFFEDTLHGAQSYRAADSPHLLGIPVFVDSYNNFIGHGGSTALIGLGVGVLLYASRWKKWAWIGWASVGAILFWMMVDHGLANYGGSVSPDRWVAPVRWVWELDQRGALSPYIGFGLILAVMAVERALLWRTLKKFPRLPAGLCAEYVRRPLSAGLGYSQLRAAAMRVRVLGIYVMTYRQLAYTLARAPGDARLDRLELSDALAKRAGEVMMAQQAVRRS